MAVLAECPVCHMKQAVSNKLCRDCNTDLYKQKKSKKVKYWIQYRLPGGKQRKECISVSIEEARDAEEKRRSQKREGRIFDMLPEAKTTFNELTEWYIKLKSVENLASFVRVKQVFKNFNEVFGQRAVNTIKPMELEEYQV
jgi:hypothetical protein